MSAISSSCGAQNRSTDSEARKAALLDAIARRASRYSGAQLREILGSSWPRPEISYLKNRRNGHFGWERLFYAAEKLGVRVDVSVSVSEAA